MSKYWEIVQLADGSFALQSSEQSDQPLVRIEFSAEAELLLKGQVVNVARAMIGAGLQEASFDQESAEKDSIQSTNQTLH